MMSQSEMGTPLSLLLTGWVDIPDPSTEVMGLCLDSRMVRPGDLFFALSGSQYHGMGHAASAVAKGACAILYDPAGGGSELAVHEWGVPCISLAQLNQKIGYIADRFYAEPSSQMSVVGITGTNGKTSCSHFLAAAMEADGNSAVIGTLGWGVPGKLQPTAHTTPDAIEVHSLLAKLLAGSFKNVAIEASSHGLDQGRLNGIRFEGCLFTNLSRDHLDYHLTMESYLEAKLRLVTWPGLKFIALNLEDECAGSIIERAADGVRKIGFALTEKHHAYPGVEIVQALAIEQGHNGLSFDIHYNGEQTRFNAPLFGSFNVENLMGVVAVLLAKGFKLQEVKQRLKKITAVPGRMERVPVAQDAIAVVDYAHTPDALEKALKSLRLHCRGSLWVVFGCGGDRDSGKRVLMGSIAEQLADQVVLTDDNPRFEDGDSIIKEIMQGSSRQGMMVIRDRRLAIAHVLERLGPGDVLLVAGKGHENTQEIKGVRHPFNDREIIIQLQAMAREREALCA